MEQKDHCLPLTSKRLLFLATKVAISFVYYSPRTIKCTQKPKIQKKVYSNRPIERASERMPFSTSYLQLALAHARNSRVKNDHFLIALSIKS